MSFRATDVETLKNELNSVFDSCSERDAETVSLQDLFDRLAEIYGNECIQLFQETLTTKIGLSGLNQMINKEEFFQMMKGFIVTPSQANPIESTPVSRYKSRKNVLLKRNILNESYELSRTESEPSRQQIENHAFNLCSLTGSLEKRLVAAESTVQNLEHKLSNEKLLNSKLNKDLKRLREETEKFWNLEEQLEESARKINSLEAKYHSVKNELLILSNKLELKESQSNFLKNENKNLKKDLNSHFIKANKFENIRNSMKNEIDSLKSFIAQMEGEIHELKSEKVLLNFRIEQLINDKEELKLQLKDSDSFVVLTEPNMVANGLNSPQESGANNEYQSTNNDSPSLLTELTLLQDNSVKGNLFSSTPQYLPEEKKASVIQGTQTPVIEVSEVGVSTSELNNENHNLFESSTQTDPHCTADVGLSVTIPSPSEQLKSTRGVQVDQNNITALAETNRSSEKADEPIQYFHQPRKDEHGQHNFVILQEYYEIIHNYLNSENNETEVPLRSSAVPSSSYSFRKSTIGVLFILCTIIFVVLLAIVTDDPYCILPFRNCCRICKPFFSFHRTRPPPV